MALAMQSYPLTYIPYTHIKIGLSLMKRSIPDRFPNIRFITMKKNAPTLQKPIDYNLLSIIISMGTERITIHMSDMVVTWSHLSVVVEQQK